jgi:hypothetical protein
VAPVLNMSETLPMKKNVVSLEEYRKRKEEEIRRKKEYALHFPGDTIELSTIDFELMSELIDESITTVPMPKDSSDDIFTS